MSQPPRDFQQWMRSVERTLNEVKRSGQSAVSTQIKREIAKVEGEISAVGDPRTPSAPIELITQTYVLPESNGKMVGYIGLDFPDVTLATDGTAIDIREYEMWGRRIDDVPGGQPLPPMRRVDASEYSSLSWYPLVPGATYEVAARAIGLNTVRSGLMSEHKTVIVALDNIAPPIPSQLVLTQKFSVVTAMWDGLGSGVGETMPQDFSYTEYRVRLPDATYIEPGDRLAGPGNFYDTNAPYDVTVYYSHRAVDTSGNKSGWSIESGIAVTPLVDEQSIRDALDAASASIDAVALDLANSSAALSGRLDTAESDLAASAVRLTDAEDRVTSIETTIPGMESRLAGAEGQISTLETVTIPGLDGELAAAEGRLTTAEGTLAEKMDQVTGLPGNKVFHDVLSGSHATASSPDYLVIQTTIGVTSSVMARIKIQGSELSRNGTIDVDLSFYAYNTGGGTIHSPYVSSDGSRQVRVQLATDANDNIAIILEPLVSTTWAYLRISVPEYQMGYIDKPETAVGWTSSLVADLTPYTRLVTPDARDLDDTNNLTQGWRATGTVEINGGKIKADTVTALQILAKTITAAEIAAASLTSASGVFGTMDASVINAGTLSTLRLNAADIRAHVLSAGKITAGDIVSGTLTSASGVFGTMDASVINAGTLNVARLNAVDIAAATAAFQTVDIKNLFAGTGTFDTAVVDKFWADVMTANKINTNMLVVGSGNNALVDPYFTDQGFKDFRSSLADIENGAWGSNATFGLNWYGASSQPTDRSKNFYFVASDAFYDTEALIPVEPGSTWRLRARINSSGYGARFTARYVKRDGTPGYIGISPYYPTGIQDMEHLWEIPTDFAYVQLSIQWGPLATSCYIYGGATVTAAADASLIVDGGIIARHITASEDLTAKIATFLSVTTGMLESNAVTADKISVGAIEAQHMSLSSVPRDALQFQVDEAVPFPLWPTTAQINAGHDLKGPHTAAVPYAYSTGGTYLRHGQERVLLINGSAFTAQHTYYMSNPVTANAGEKVHISIEGLVAGSTPDWDLRIRTLPYDASGAVIEYSTGVALDRDEAVWYNNPDPVAATRGSFVYTLPPGTVSYVINMYPSRRAAPSYSEMSGSWIVNKISVKSVMSSTGSTGRSTELSPQGFRLFNEDGGEVVSLTSMPPNYLGILDGLGTTLASLSDDGTVAGHGLNIEQDPTFMGEKLFGNFINYETPNDVVVDGVLDTFPRGVTAYGTYDFRDWIPVPSGYTGEAALMELAFNGYPDRAYRVTMTPISIIVNGSGNLSLNVRRTTDGTRPTLDSSIIYKSVFHGMTEGTTNRNIITMSGSFIIMRGIESTQRLLFSVYLDEALTVPRFVDFADAAMMRVMVEDVGPNVSDKGVRRTDRTLTAVSTGTTTAEKPTPPAEKKAYTKVYTATNHRSYTGSGSTYTLSGSEPNRLYQGQSPYGPTGILRSIATFPSFTGDLSGATITSIRVYFYFDHWYNNSGGNAQIMLHGASTPPSTRPSMTYATTSSGWPKPGGRWVSIPSNLWAGFKSGAYRGIGLGNGTSGNAYYGYARSAAKVEIKYSK